MVSAKAGVGPIYAIRRTAAAAEVANFTPRILGNPFLSFTGPSVRLDRAPLHFESVSRLPPYSARKRCGTPRPAGAVETLDVQHPGHTSDSERDFNSRLSDFEASGRLFAAAKRLKQETDAPV
jgi:hypothetical protein